jgi:hypothetical protein
LSLGNSKKGNYNFQVRTNQENMQEINFYIHPAFWQTNWFYGLVAVGVIAISSSL